MADLVPSDHSAPIDDDVGGRALAYLQALARAGRLSAENYDDAAQCLFAASSEGELRDLITALPTMVRFADSSRRLAVPFRVMGGMQTLRLDGRWQVAAQIVVEAGMGNCTIDFSEAEFDSRVTEMWVSVAIGRVTLIIPEWIDVERVDAAGGVNWRLGYVARVPGLPLIRLAITPGLGKVTLRRPRDHHR